VESAGVSPGLGLVGMQERVRLVGGRFAISSGPRLGTRVEVRVKANGR
jgi:signal transduction histidine kinase